MQFSIIISSSIVSLSLDVLESRQCDYILSSFLLRQRITIFSLCAQQKLCHSFWIFIILYSFRYYFSIFLIPFHFFCYVHFMCIWCALFERYCLLGPGEMVKIKTEYTVHYFVFIEAGNPQSIYDLEGRRLYFAKGRVRISSTKATVAPCTFPCVLRDRIYGTKNAYT